MKKSFMTRVLAVSLSAAMTFSLSAANMATASAATKNVVLSPSTVTLQYGTSKAKKTLKLKNNSLKWKIKSASVAEKGSTAKGKKLLTISKTSSKVVLKAKNIKKSHKATVTVKVKRTKNKKTYSKTLKCKVTVNPQKTEEPDVTPTPTPTPDVPTPTPTQAPDNPSVTDDYYLLLETNSDEVLADGHANTLITCTVKDKDGNTYTDKDFVIKFETNGRGHFTRSEVVTSKGQTTNTLISEALDKAEDVIVTAQIVRAVRDNDLGEQFKGTKGQKKLTMTPSLTNAKYNQITSVESNYADRITLHFADNVDDDFYKTNGAMDPDKLKVEVFDNIPSSGTLPANPKFSNAKDEDGVVNLKEVQGEPKALHVLVKSPLTDGSTIGVRVTQKNPETGKNQVFTDYFKLTDSQRPSLMSVEATDRRTLRVTFSEAVLTTKVADIANRSVLANYCADTSRNYSINRDRLDDAKWGVDANSFTVGSGKDGDDDRNVVTIKLGKDASGEYARFQEEVETLLSANNIGDWAANSDLTNNVMETDELYFIAPKDDKAPAFEKVEVQSPEQYLVTFNSPVEISASYKNSHSDVAGITVANAATDGTTSENNADQTSVIQLVENGTNIGKAEKDGGTNPIRVTEIGTDHTTYLIETTKDWSKVYNSTGSYNDNYNIKKYQLKIPADAIVNINNGMKNAGEIVEELTANHAEMQTLDVTQPAADDLSWDGKSATVTFNEPVKVRLENQKTGLNKEGLTPSIRQEKDNSQGVQQVTATFHATGYQEVTGTINRISDSYDKQIVVTPNQELTGSEAGVDWNLTIRGISDDVGNTGTVTKSFKVTNKTTGFKVAWASVSTKDSFDWTANKGNNGNKDNFPWNAGADSDTWNPGDKLYVFVKFTGPIGNEAMRVRNYTLGSSQLPTNVNIYSGIKGYDDNSSIKDSITIELPWNVASLISENKSNVMMTITNAVVSATGQNLENNVEYQLPYNASKVDTSRTDNDAVFGDDFNEQPYDAVSNPSGIKSNYETAVKEAIESDQYRVIKLAQGVGTLDVNRPVDIDLNGMGVTKLNANFNDGATCHIINTSAMTTAIDELVINTPNADWNLNEDPNGSGFTLTPNIVCKKVDIRRMPAKTLNNGAQIDELVVNTIGSAIKVVNKSTGIIKEIVLNAVNKDGKVTVKNDSSASKIKISVKSPVQIEIDKASENNSISEVYIADGVTKDVVLQTKANVVGTLSGSVDAATIKKENGDPVKKEDIKDIIPSVEAASGNELKNIVLNRLNSSVTVSDSSIKMDDLVKELSKAIYENKAVINTTATAEKEEYDIVISLDGKTPTKETSILNKTPAPAEGSKFTTDAISTIGVGDDAKGVEDLSSITVYIKKTPATLASNRTPEYIKVKDITVNK